MLCRHMLFLDLFGYIDSVTAKIEEYRRQKKDSGKSSRFTLKIATQKNVCASIAHTHIYIGITRGESIAIFYQSCRGGSRSDGM